MIFFYFCIFLVPRHLRAINQLGNYTDNFNIIFFQFKQVIFFSLRHFNGQIPKSPTLLWWNYDQVAISDIIYILIQYNFIYTK